MKHDRIVLAEALSNSSNGKTSAGKLFGAIIVIVGLLSFAYTLIFLSTSQFIVQILSSCGALVFFGSSLILGKIVKPTNLAESHEVDKKENISE